MKKFTSVLLAVILIMAFSVPALASNASVDAGKAVDITVKKTVKINANIYDWFTEGPPYNEPTYDFDVAVPKGFTVVPVKTSPTVPHRENVTENSATFVFPIAVKVSSAILSGSYTVKFSGSVSFTLNNGKVVKHTYDSEDIVIVVTNKVQEAAEAAAAKAKELAERAAAEAAKIITVTSVKLVGTPVCTDHKLAVVKNAKGWVTGIKIRHIFDVTYDQYNDYEKINRCVQKGLHFDKESGIISTLKKTAIQVGTIVVDVDNPKGLPQVLNLTVGSVNCPGIKDVKITK